MRQTIYSPQSSQKCFICDELIPGQPLNLTECETNSSREKVTKKLARMVGDDFCVIVSEEDVICRRCFTLFNTMDKAEFELNQVRSKLRGYINKKYSIEDDEPPAKMVKLSSNPTPSRFQQNSSPTVRKIYTGTGAEQLKNLTSPAKKGPVKLYKCIACDFKTTDLNAFTPHSAVCKGQASKNTPSPSQNRIVRQVYSPAQRQVAKITPDKGPQKVVGGTTIVRNSTPQSPIGLAKPRPFKCRMCLERFETREAATTHARIHTNPGGGFKCGICSRQYSKRELFDAHMKTHEKFKSVSQQESISLKSKGVGAGQKPLTEIIKEALSEDDQDAVNELIEFHSCNLCSLTFVNKKLFAQHMKTHEGSSEAKSDAKSVAKSKQQDTMGDLESIFEKMHSEGVHHGAASNGNDKNVLITTQEGGFTYNITIPQDDVPQSEGEEVSRVCSWCDDCDFYSDSFQKPTGEPISMPALSDVVEPEKVSMPSLHGDDEENTQSSQEQTEVQQVEGAEAVPMEIDDLQNAGADGQQLKFIVDENGQFLQLDNHILTTDAEGNQILVQGTDQEQLQHLLQSVGAVGPDGNQMLVQLQGNGEEGEEQATIQLGEGGEHQGQMILVQGADGETQLIDASMLQTEDGNLVLQQGEDGQIHLTTADGIPVSMTFGGEGAEGQLTVSMAEGHEGEGEQQIFLQQGDSQEGDSTSELTQTQQEVPDDPLAEASTQDVSSTTEEKAPDAETKQEE